MCKNKKNFNYFLEENDDEFLALTKYCEWGNCQKKGEYKAPTSREKLREFFEIDSNHIAYNALLACGLLKEAKKFKTRYKLKLNIKNPYIR